MDEMDVVRYWIQDSKDMPLLTALPVNAAMLEDV